MKIALAAPSPVGFVIGGAEKLFMGMLANFNRFSPHDVDLIKIPCKDQEFWPLMEGYRNFSQLNLDHFDMVITTKYPAWMIRHRNHVVYTQHTCRGLYDLYHLCKKPTDWQKIIKKEGRLARLGRMLGRLPDRSLLDAFFSELFHLRTMETSLPAGTFDFPGPLTRKIVHFLDTIALLPNAPAHPYGIKSYNAISENVARRKDYFPGGVNVNIIHHPSDLENLKTTGHDYIFTASRLEDLKRIDLLIKAFKKVKTDIHLRIAGTGGRKSVLEELAADDPRIEFLGFVTDEELVEHYSRALFVPFVPFDEDYGLITIEAMKCKKAVVTVSDAGGVNEFVHHGTTGMIAEPNVQDLAQAMQYLVDHREETINMGENAFRAVSHIHWKNMAAALLAIPGTKLPQTRVYRTPAAFAAGTNDGRLSLLILSTFSVDPPDSGGKLRLYNLYKGLSKHCDITMLSMGKTGGTFRIADRFTEIRVKTTAEFKACAKRIRSETQVSSDDIAAIKGYSLIPEFKNQLSWLIPQVDAVVLAHPYLYYAVADIKKPLFYDAPNVEYRLKSAMFDTQSYLDSVKALEQALCRRADLIYPCSEKDRDDLISLYGIPGEKCLVVENGVNVKEVKMPAPSEKKALKKRLGLKGKTVAVFAGSGHKPNEEAALYIRSLAKHYPQAVFIIIGAAGAVLDTHPDNLIPLGVVSKEDKDVLMRAADIGLNPVVSGSGTNLKIVEYLAFGLAVLSTDFGARGINHKDELFTCKIAEFREEFGRVKEKIKFQDQLSAKARTLSMNYDWETISSRLASRLRAQIKNRQGT